MHVSSARGRTRFVPDFKALAAEKWFGYGRWSAPYWFVGMEPGGAEEPLVYSTWHDSGAPELLDLLEHSTACHDTRLVVGEPPLQPTWKQLIRLVLGYEGKPAGNEDVREYQRDCLGRRAGQTLLIEISSVNAKSLSVTVPEREAHRAERIATIRRRMLENKPDFIVFYGLRYADAYAEVAGGPFDSDRYRWNGPTLCALVRHPTAIPTSPASSWTEKGAQMRALRSAAMP